MLALDNRDTAELGARRVVLVHVTRLEQSEDPVRPCKTYGGKPIASFSVELGDHLLQSAGRHRVGRGTHNNLGVARFHRPGGRQERGDAGGPPGSWGASHRKSRPSVAAALTGRSGESVKLPSAKPSTSPAGKPASSKASATACPRRERVGRAVSLTTGNSA